jgi:NAD(P)-dependent dehydrogenase (short-subunit alcohol dehydrogenase family)
VTEITGKGGQAVAVQANVARKPEIERLFAETRKAFGRLDILVNNAGIYEFAPPEGVKEEHFHKPFDLTVLGLILTTQEAVNILMARAEASSTSARGGQHAHSPKDVGLQRHQSCGRRSDPITGQGIGAAEHPRKFHQPWDGGNGGCACRRQWW